MQYVLKILILILIFMFSCAVHARGTTQQPDAHGRYEYIVSLFDPALVHFEGDESVLSNSGGVLQATSPAATGAIRLHTDTDAAKAYRNYLDGRYRAVQNRAEQQLGISLTANFRYYNLVNGFSVYLTPEQAGLLNAVTGIRSVDLTEIYQLETFAGPEWINADRIWLGDGNIPASRGEGIIVGVVDSGVNWDHASFADIGGDGFNHSNPLGRQLGLCGDPQVRCNDKLIGIYDYTTEGTKGKDVSGHGTHTASLAVGNVTNITVNMATSGSPRLVEMQLKGVANHANLIVYKTCRGDDPTTVGTNERGCSGAAVLQAFEQAINDQVSVINYSLGNAGQTDPWATINSGQTGILEWLLLLREAGVFVSVAAGNDGPGDDTIGTPSHAPWAPSIGASTSDGIIGHNLEALSGGTSVLSSLISGTGISAGTGTIRPIVHAKDMGFDDAGLCGVGPPEVATACNRLTGASNPFPPGTFNGEIVVCERGVYGRVEKGRNLQLAGAGGYILVNDAGDSEQTVSDEHCLPAIHLGHDNSEKLQGWLASGTGHMGRIGPLQVTRNAFSGGLLGDFSSRGPNGQFVQDVLKPNLVAPGVAVFGAGVSGTNSFPSLSGTSMAAPHVAGAAALLKAVNPSWTPGYIMSALETTASTGFIRVDSGAEFATPHERGHGRPGLGVAAVAGIVLDVSGAEFRAANPATGGAPGALNMAGLVERNCVTSCRFIRTVTDTQGGGDWQVTSHAEFAVTVTPSQFSLGNGESQELVIDVSVSDPTQLYVWEYGEIRLNNVNAPTAKFTVAVRSSAGELPSAWTINSDTSSGAEDFELTGIMRLTNPAYSTGVLQRPLETTMTLRQDLTATAFDGGPGTFLVWHEVNTDSLMFRAEVLDSSAGDVDLYIGFDANQNGIAEQAEVLCAGKTPLATERCELLAPLPGPGNVWVLVQNFSESSSAGDAITLRSAVIDLQPDRRFVPHDDPEASVVLGGPYTTPATGQFTVRAGWENVAALPGEQWWGAAALGFDDDDPIGIGVIPIFFNRSAADPDSAFVMSDGYSHTRVLGSQSRFERLVIDVPTMSESLNFNLITETANQIQDLKMSAYFMGFPEAVSSGPHVAGRPAHLQIVDEVAASNGTELSLAINARELRAGRYYLDIENTGTSAVAFELIASIETFGRTPQLHQGWWDLVRDGRSMFQGFDYVELGATAFAVWYSYDEFGLPVWYVAQSPRDHDSDVWTADLIRATGDGIGEQKLTVVGTFNFTAISASEGIMSFQLDGQFGSMRTVPVAEPTCPVTSGQTSSYSGIWFDGNGKMGGESILVLENTQQQLHYFYDRLGAPRWVTTDGGSGPLAEEQQVLEVRAACALCEPVNPTLSAVGVINTVFASEDAAQYVSEFTLSEPLGDHVSRAVDIIKISERRACLSD